MTTANVLATHVHLRRGCFGMEPARSVAERSGAAAIGDPNDDVADAVVEARVDHSRSLDVEQAWHSLTVLQRSAVDLAFFKGLTCLQATGPAPG